MTTDEIQAVYDDAYAAGILEEPMTAKPGDGVTAARIDIIDGAPALVETVAGR